MKIFSKLFFLVALMLYGLTLLMLRLPVVNAETIALPTANSSIASVSNDAAANAAIGNFLNRIVQLIFFAAIPIALYAIFMTSYQLVTSKGDPAGYQKVKQNLLALLTGFFIFAAGLLVIKLVVSLLISKP